MTLTTHAVVGAAIAAAMPNHPVLGIGLAFASHFALDAIPHWDYHLRSMAEDEANPLKNDMKLGRDFVIDLGKIGFDFLLGLVLAYLVGNLAGAPARIALLVVAGGLAGQFPDFLQFVYFKFRRPPITWLQRFHMWVHTTHKLKHKPVIGVLSQLGLIIAVLLLVQYH
jgi:hypothetical protein